MENIVRKKEIACNKRFLLFSQCFLPYMVLIFHFKCTLICHLQFVSIWTCLEYFLLLMGYQHSTFQFKPFPNKAQLVFTFLLYNTFKNTWEKEKLLIISNFSLPQSVFYPFGEFSAIIIKFEIVICKVFQFERV